jgi:hypothetical protein
MKGGHMFSLRAWALMGFICVMGGCRASQLESDQADIRTTVLRLYQQQVFDNLIRTKLNYPIIQVDYSNITGTVSQVASASVNEGYTHTHNSFAANAAGALISAVRSSVFGVGGAGSETASLTITGQPVINSDDVYKAYEDAIKDDHDIVTNEQPKFPDKVYLKQEFGPDHATWYISNAKASKFFKVYLATTVKRQPKAILTTTVKVKILSIVSTTPIKNSAVQLELRLEDKVLNDSGQLTASINGIEYQFNYQPVKDVPSGQLTDRLLLMIDTSTAPNLSAADMSKALANTTVTLKNENYYPGYIVSTPDKSEPVRSQLEQIRLQGLSH